MYAKQVNFRNFQSHSFIYNLLAMITRRSFLQQSAMLGAALSMNPSELFKFQKVLGLQLYTVRDEVTKNLDTTIAQVATAGYTHIELYGYEYKTRLFFGRTVKQFADLLKKNNLKTPSGHYGVSDFLYERNYNWDSWKRLIDDAHTLGHKYIVIPHIDDKHRKADDFKLIAERLNKGGEISKTAGLITGYHNHDFEFAAEAEFVPYEYMLQHTDPKLVKFEMDLYWMKYAKQDPIAWFKKYPHRFPMWHLKDMEGHTEGKATGQTCEVGSGIINWKEIFKYQDLAGLDYAFVEQEQYRRPVFECIKTSADYIRKNLLSGSYVNAKIND